jgi:hypothetical protein
MKWLELAYDIAAVNAALFGLIVIFVSILKEPKD